MAADAACHILLLEHVWCSSEVLAEDRHDDVLPFLVLEVATPGLHLLKDIWSWEEYGDAGRSIPSTRERAVLREDCGSFLMCVLAGFLQSFRGALT